MDAAGSADGAVVVEYDAEPPPPDAFRPPDAAPGAPDARPVPDAFEPPDANLPPDAAAGGLCDGNEDCIASECCYILLCVPGERFGALCFPAE